MDRRESLQLLHSRLPFHLRPDKGGEDRSPADNPCGCATAEVDKVHCYSFSLLLVSHSSAGPVAVGPALLAWPLRGTLRIQAAAGRHSKVPAGWNVTAGRSVTRRCYRAGTVSGDQAELPGPGDGLGAVGGAEL